METVINNNPPKLIIKRTISAKRERVFEAWTNQEIMSKWFICGAGQAIVSNELKLGGSYQTKMVFDAAHGCEKTGENSVIRSGEYLEIIPPEKIVFTWKADSIADSLVTVELVDLGDSTELTLTHELLDTEKSREEHNFGWNGCLDNLENSLQ